MEPAAFKQINPDAFGGFKTKKFNSLPDNLIGQIDDGQFGELKPKLIGKMDEGIITSFKPKALEGMTEKQGKKMSQDVASEFDSAQIRSIQPEALAAMNTQVFELLEGNLSASQLNGLELLGDGEDIGGPVI